MLLPIVPNLFSLSVRGQVGLRATETDFIVITFTIGLLVLFADKPTFDVEDMKYLTGLIRWFLVRLPEIPTTLDS